MSETQFKDIPTGNDW